MGEEPSGTAVETTRPDERENGQDCQHEGGELSLDARDVEVEDGIGSGLEGGWVESGRMHVDQRQIEGEGEDGKKPGNGGGPVDVAALRDANGFRGRPGSPDVDRSGEATVELQSRQYLVC